jgi:hypothetical protein
MGTGWVWFWPACCETGKIPDHPPLISQRLELGPLKERQGCALAMRGNPSQREDVRCTCPHIHTMTYMEYPNQGRLLCTRDRWME